MTDADLFFEKITPMLSPSERRRFLQKDGFQTIFIKWNNSGLTDLRWLAYMLATAWHETARTMQPIEEYGKGSGKPYGIPDPDTGKTYYGRGYVQLTWKENYRKMGKLLNVDLVNYPDSALLPAVAVEIMFEGMLKASSNIGDFTGKSLEQYFNDSAEDWINARRIINGLDCAVPIASYAKRFYEALKN